MRPSLPSVVPMSVLAPSVLAFLQAVADSTAPRLVVERSWLDTLANVAQSLVSLLIMAMLVMGVVLLYALRKSIDELTKLVRSANTPLQGAISEARAVTGEVRAIAMGLKAPLAMAGDTLEDASERVQDVMEAVEGRLARFDSLVGIAQEEAEGAVIGAASLLRGVRAGGAVVRESLGLGRGARRKRRRAGRSREGASRNGTHASDERPSRQRSDRRERAARSSEADAPDGAEAPRIRARADSQP